GGGREYELPVTGRRALRGARRDARGHEVGGIEDQLAGSVIDQTVAQAEPIVAGVDPDTILIRGREVLDLVGARCVGEAEYEGVRAGAAPQLVLSSSTDQDVA